MIVTIYKAVDLGLLNETHLKNQKLWVKSLLQFRRHYIKRLGVKSIRFSELVDILKAEEKEYYTENEHYLNVVSSDSTPLDILKIQGIVLESLKDDLDNPKLPLDAKISLTKLFAEQIQVLTESKQPKAFNPFADVEYTVCPITFLAPYTRSGKGDAIVLAAPEKTGKTALTLINVVDDCINGKKVLYLDYANGWEEIQLRIISKLTGINLGKLSVDKINTVLKTAKSKETFGNLMRNLTYFPFPTKKDTEIALRSGQYDYVVFDDLHRLRFDKNDAESILKSYGWALDLIQATAQCGLILGHPNDANASFDSFTLSGGIRLHKDMSTIIAMLKVGDNLEIKIIRERKKVADLHMQVKLVVPLAVEFISLSEEQDRVAEVSRLKPLKADTSEFDLLGDIGTYVTDIF